ncbi:MAG: helicase [Trizodia sp. TS-e1964]|nr:MAG: helicase [Trizodia sp. TS-e1964]
MLNKPFRPPLLRKGTLESPKCEIEGPASKKRKTIDSEYKEEKPTQNSGNASAFKPIRKPLLSLKDSAINLKYVESSELAVEAYFNVLWRKFTLKKHKTWDGDGVLSVHDGFAYLQDTSGLNMGRIRLDLPLAPGSTLSISGKDVEIDSILCKEDFLAGRPSLGSEKVIPKPETKKFIAPKPVVMLKSRPKGGEEGGEQRILIATVPISITRQENFKTPLLSSTIQPGYKCKEPTPRHDPHQLNALVMKRPAIIPKGKQVVDVVVDPLLGQHLRQHQREGVEFLYECVMGMRPFNGAGAILADEMGLGKTLQTITLLWTLLKQNPIYEASPVIKKALIVCPVTLINNWRKEFRKWLGNERIGVFVADGTKTRFADFTMGKSYSVMIIGYEKLRSVHQELSKGAGIDIVIADEGHRLKTAQNKSAQAILALNTPRRVILSGTPIQNDLSEFFAMVDFVNPGLLGTRNTFKNEFEGPILKSRQPGCTKNDVEKGGARAEELQLLTRHFILRRTSEILSKFLPPKSEYVLFCRPTAIQRKVYQAVIESPSFSQIIGSPEASLQLITVLKKLCNCPTLLRAKSDNNSSNSDISSILSSVNPSLLHTNGAHTSGKLLVLDRLLRILSSTTEEKIVLVSNYTATLDLLQRHLVTLDLSFVRLDGSTPPGKRQSIVENFNRTSSKNCFAFLLSAKSGGAGLNLIGASRLVLFELDWNPSTDLQAMARIHRDGQKKHVRIYRMLTVGALDEKIYQRQLTKQGLADSVMDNKASTSSFSMRELKDLFSLDTESICQTHDLLGCCCSGTGCDLLQANSRKIDCREGKGNTEDEEEEFLPFASLVKASMLKEKPELIKGKTPKISSGSKLSGSGMNSLMEYKHLDTTDPTAAHMKEMIDDEVLLEALEGKGNRISYIFTKSSS